MSRPSRLDLTHLTANYHAYALGEGKPVMDAFRDLDAVYPALRAVSLAGLPAAFAMIEPAEIEMRRTNPEMLWNDRLKKFLGICTLRAMALFNHPPLRIKRAIPHPAFSRGEVYSIHDYTPTLHARTFEAAATTSSAAEVEP